MYKNIIIVGLVVILAAVLGFGIYQSGHQITAGAVTGPSGLGTFDESIHANGQVQSGGLYTPTSTSTQTALTLDAASLTTNSVVILTPGASAASTLTATLPSTTTLATLNPLWLPNIGDTATVYVLNASTATTTTIATGSGITLMSASSTAVIQAGKAASLEFIRNTASTLLVGMQVMY